MNRQNVFFALEILWATKVSIPNLFFFFDKIFIPNWMLKLFRYKIFSYLKYSIFKFKVFSKTSESNCNFLLKNYIYFFSKIFDLLTLLKLLSFKSRFIWWHNKKSTRAKFGEQGKLSKLTSILRPKIGKHWELCAHEHYHDDHSDYLIWCQLE